MVKLRWLFIALFVVTVGCVASEAPEASQPGPKTISTQALSAAPTATRFTPIDRNTRNAPVVPSPVATSAATNTPGRLDLFYSADDERIRYIGRFDFSDPDNPAFDWSATAIEFTFEGVAAAILLEDGRNYYNIHVDDQISVLKSEPDQLKYIIAENLAPGEHQIRITKRTEAYVGAAIFKGLQITGQGLKPAQPKNARVIEFIGDSITTGYGNEGDMPDCWFTPRTENAEQSYAAFTAYDLHAEYSLVALSGLGIVRNLRDENAAASQTAIDFIGRALGMNPTVPWPPELSSPSAVVINLGTNDYSSIPFPKDEDFVGAYIDLLNAVRSRYPQAAILAVAGPLMLDPAPRNIETAVKQFTAYGDDNTVFVPIEDNLDRSALDFGCDWHPNTNGQRKIAEQLTLAMARELGW